MISIRDVSSAQAHCAEVLADVKILVILISFHQRLTVGFDWFLKKKRESHAFCSFTHSVAFALPISVERAMQKPHAEYDTSH